MSWIAPVTNRTFNDVVNAKQIRSDKVQKFQPTTAEEDSTLEKGALTITTLNRIENNQKELQKLLNLAGYWETPLQNKATEWTNEDILFAYDWQRILKNQTYLKNAFFVHTATPNVPDTKLNYINLNALEQILYDLNDMITIMKANYRRCNTFRCGEARS